MADHEWNQEFEQENGQSSDKQLSVREDAVTGEVLDGNPPASSPKELPPVEAKRSFGFGVFLVCILFGFLVSMQFKSVKVSNNTITSSQLRAEELQSLLNKERAKNQELYEELLRSKDDLSSYRQMALQSGDYAAVLNSELTRAQLAAGFTDVVGPGLIITMSDSAGQITESGADSNYYIIHDNDILQVVNELRDAGAEAISINGERLLATSEIRCAGSTISVNNNRYVAPYVICAIGDAEGMSSALRMRGGVIEQLAIWGIQIELQKSDEVLIAGYTGKTSFQYARERLGEGEGE
ncbi:MAG: DUF881 domain-containing protein [Clostridia bacterium]|nr:DUF881 domain-containing protein [Clostridia bacterium]MBQ6058790.1 DUF881 domain-containing protein [Clostridia bacterium]